MTALAYPMLTGQERETALDAISAHFTEIIADAETIGDWESASLLLIEAANWAGDHELTEDRIGKILAWAPEDEREAVRRFLDGGL